MREHYSSTNDFIQHKVLITVSQYETRVLEQALKVYLGDGLNVNGPVSFPVNWHSTGPRNVPKNLFISK